MKKLDELSWLQDVFINQTSDSLQMAILLEHYDHSQLVEAAGSHHPYTFILNAAQAAPDAFGHAMNERGVSDSTVYELLEAKFGKMTDFSAPVFTYESYQDSFYATSNNPYHVRTLGDKRYELTNHLGNVLAVVSDRKVAVEDQGNPGTVEYYEADVVSAQDYYPFGMIQPGRSVSAGEYRYGLHGMEMDNEISGTGNSYTAEFWQYDPRLGRRWNVDPVDATWESSYAVFRNQPILLNDPFGDCPNCFDGFMSRFQQALADPEVQESLESAQEHWRTENLVEGDISVSPKLGLGAKGQVGPVHLGMQVIVIGGDGSVSSDEADFDILILQGAGNAGLSGAQAEGNLTFFTLSPSLDEEGLSYDTDFFERSGSARTKNATFDNTGNIGANIKVGPFRVGGSFNFGRAMAGSLDYLTAGGQILTRIFTQTPDDVPEGHVEPGELEVEEWDPPRE